MSVLDIKKCDFSLVDGSGSPKSVTLRIGDGTLSYSEKKPREYIKDKGELYDVRDADEEPMEVSFGFLWEFLLSEEATAATPTIEEALKRTGAASDWVSSDTANPCAPYAVDIKVVYNPACTGVKKETYLLPDYRYETLEHDFKAATVSSSGMSHATEPTITRST